LTTAEEVLGGARQLYTRPRGFLTSWRPQQHTQDLLDQVKGVLEEYVDYLPMTIRQIFYRLVGAHEYDKTERAYDRLCETLNKGRRARLIEMEDIRDDGVERAEVSRWTSAEDILEDMRLEAESFHLDRSLGQKTRLVVWCEAAGMLPQLARIANPYGIDVYSCGGFDSLTEKYKQAEAITKANRPTEVLHIGDHDPSGGSMFNALSEDVQAFASSGLVRIRDPECGMTPFGPPRSSRPVQFSRLAVTPQQITDLRLPTAPPKPSDNRAFRGQTCQAEAIAPDVLADILRRAIESRIDRAAYQRILEKEERERAEVIQRLRPTLRRR
jgi:hypothetical protein